MKIAAITMVFNERFFLPMWIAHYGRAFGEPNLFVVDDGSSDGSTAGLGQVNVMTAARSELDEDQRAARISDLHTELLSRYDAVIYCDVDELLVVDPLLGMDLPTFIERRVPSHINAIGFNVIFDGFTEPPIDPSRPLFAQRNHLQFDWAYCKLLISRIPTRWGPGFHNSDHPTRFTKGLFLFHIRAIDPRISLERIRNFNTVKLSENSRAKGHAGQFLISDRDYLKKYFIDRLEPFQQAVPAADFDATCDEIYNALQLGPPKRLRAMGKPVLKLPDRFRDSIAPFASSAKSAPPIARNAPCPCGSGKRFKNCHGAF